MLFRLDGRSSPDQPGMAQATLSVTGIDRTGLVARVSRWLRDHRANIDEGIVTRLEKDVHTGSYLIHATTQSLDEMQRETQDCPEEEVSAGVKVRGGAMYDLNLIAPDRIGLINDVAEILAGSNVNVVTMACLTFDPPRQHDSGGPSQRDPERRRKMVALRMGLEVPPESMRLLPGVMDDLRTLGAEDRWDIRMQERKTGPHRNGVGLSELLN